MATETKRGLGGRAENEDGRIRKKRSDTQVGTLRYSLTHRNVLNQRQPATG